MQAAAAPSKPTSLEAATQALAAAVHAAQQNKAAYEAALASGTGTAPTGVVPHVHCTACCMFRPATSTCNTHPQAGLSIPGAAAGSSLNHGLTGAAMQWGDPNAQLDCMLNDALRQAKTRAPTLRRRPQQQQQPADSAAVNPAATGGGSGSSGSGGESASWELVSSPNNAAPGEAGGTNNAPAAAGGSNPQLGALTEEGGVDYYDHDAEYELYYADEGEDDGGGLYGEAAQGGEMGGEDLGAGGGGDGQEAADEDLQQVLGLRLQVRVCVRVRVCMFWRCKVELRLWMGWHAQGCCTTL